MYGGCPFLVVRRADQLLLVFAEKSDQRLYMLPLGSTQPPVAISPPPPSSRSWRFAEIIAGPAHDFWCIREMHAEDHSVSRDLVAVSTAGTLRSLISVPAANFYSHPRLSPSGTRLCFLTWSHPNMPWDSTRLHVADVDASGHVTNDRIILGGDEVSVLSPEWLNDDERIVCISDSSGWCPPDVACAPALRSRRPQVQPLDRLRLGQPCAPAPYTRVCGVGRSLLACRLHLSHPPPQQPHPRRPRPPPHALPHRHRRCRSHLRRHPLGLHLHIPLLLRHRGSLARLRRSRRRPHALLPH